MVSRETSSGVKLVESWWLELHQEDGAKKISLTQLQPLFLWGLRQWPWPQMSLVADRWQWSSSGRARVYGGQQFRQNLGWAAIAEARYDNEALTGARQRDVEQCVRASWKMRWVSEAWEMRLWDRWGGPGEGARKIWWWERDGNGEKGINGRKNIKKKC